MKPATSLISQIVKKSLLISATLMLAALVVAAIIAALTVGIPGVKSVGLCAGTAVVIMLITVGSHLFSLQHPDLIMAGVGADFVLKIITIIALVCIARQLPWVHPLVLFLTILAIILVQALSFSLAVTRFRIPLLDSRTEEQELSK